MAEGKPAGDLICPVCGTPEIWRYHLRDREVIIILFGCFFTVVFEDDLTIEEMGKRLQEHKLPIRCA